MRRTCEKCGRHYDDYDHSTFCPHDYFPPSPDVQALIARGVIPPFSDPVSNDEAPR